jgi:mono/diheme cytochrome c family protein
LRYGFVEPHGVAAGPMRPVSDNLGDVSEDDVEAIAEYVGSMLAPATARRLGETEELVARRDRPEEPSGTTGRAASAPASSDVASLYAGACAPCHKPSGQRFSARGIPLAQSKVVTMPDPRNLIHIILDGIEPPIGTPAAAMPGFDGALTDRQVAELVAYLRATFSDRPAWSGVPDQLRKLRQHKE